MSDYMNRAKKEQSYHLRIGYGAVVGLAIAFYGIYEWARNAGFEEGEAAGY